MSLLRRSGGGGSGCRGEGWRCRSRAPQSEGGRPKGSIEWLKIWWTKPWISCLKMGSYMFYFVFFLTGLIIMICGKMVVFTSNHREFYWFNDSKRRKFGEGPSEMRDISIRRLVQTWLIWTFRSKIWAFKGWGCFFRACKIPVWECHRMPTYVCKMDTHCIP